jgi:uncharacterized membrane protein YgaE (UPF0421/DUF939 family)
MTDAGWSIVETPVAAGLAWYIAHSLLGHHQPFFAPCAAALSLSKNRVLRSQRALQLMAGVVLGIGAGTAVRTLAGLAPGASGATAVAVAAAVALVAALVLGGGFFARGVLFVNQSATSAILMIAVAGTATGPERLSDALIGGGVTLVITAVLFPAAPLPLIRDAARQVLAELRDTLAHLAELADTDERPGKEWALAAGQRVQSRLAGLQQARSAALQVANLAPRRWLQRSRVRQAGQQTVPLGLLAATVLSLAHASTAEFSVRQPYPRALCQALGELMLAFAALAEGGDAGDTRAVRHASRVRMVLAAGAAQARDLHTQLIASFVETCADDTLRLVGETPGASGLDGRKQDTSDCGGQSSPSTPEADPFAHWRQ